MLLVILRAEPDQYERAAVRWLGRLALERTQVDLDGLSQAAAALEALPVTRSRRGRCSPRSAAAPGRRRRPPVLHLRPLGRGLPPEARFAQRRELAHPAQPAERARLDLAHPLGRDARAGGRSRAAASAPPRRCRSAARRPGARGRAARRARPQGLGAQRDVHLVLGRGPSAGSRSPNAASSSSPSGRSSDVTARAASRSACRSSSVRSASAASSASVGGRSSLSASAFSARASLRWLRTRVDREPDRARLGVHPALDRLADPPGRVGREAVALAPVELLDGADQAEDALLDQVEQRELGALVLLRDRDDQAQVRVDHPLLGLEVAALDPLGEVDLLGRREQPVAADLVEEELQRVGRRRRELGVVERRCSFSRPQSSRSSMLRGRAARRGGRGPPRRGRAPGPARRPRRGSGSPAARPGR